MTRIQLWSGRVLSTLAVLFLTFDATLHLLRPPIVVEGAPKIGYTVGTIFVLGFVEVILLILYLIPRTAVLGAILWTGYLGGAVATHVRVGDPLFSHILFPTYIAALLWGGLWLREQRLRELIPVRR